jgi:hypothetical protein
MKKIIPLLVVSLLSLPGIAFAATVPSRTLEDIIAIVIGIFNNYLNPILFALALLAFFWGLALFILQAGNEKKRAEGRYIMTWGVIALFVMLTVVGLIKMLQATFSIDTASEVLPVPSANSSDYNLGR